MKIILSTLFTLSILISNAQLRLPKLFGDHMVLQRDIPVRFWGWASPDESIQISIDGFTTITKAGKRELGMSVSGSRGRWAFRRSGERSD